MHSNDLRSLSDTATIFYIYGKKYNDEQAISKSKQLYLDVLNNAHWNEINDWARGVAMSAFTYSTYTLWDELDSVTRDQAKSIIFLQAQLFLDKIPVSGYIGDTKAEENAWTADFLAAVVNLFPDVPNKAQLEEKAKCFAYHSITTSSDEEYCGIKTQTVYDDYSLENHNVVNPIYALSTIHLLARGAATYEIAGKEIPSEFQHNIVNMYNNFLKPNTNHNTFFSQNFENLDWSGVTNSLYLGIYTYAYLDRLSVSLDFALDDLMLKRSIFFYDIVSEWHPDGPPQQISEYVQTDLTHPSLKWFLDSNMAGEIHSMIPVLFFKEYLPETPTTFETEDLDKDGDVDFQDIILLLQDFGKTGTFESDINQDEKVDLFDLVLVAKNMI